MKNFAFIVLILFSHLSVAQQLLIRYDGGYKILDVDPSISLKQKFEIMFQTDLLPAQSKVLEVFKKNDELVLVISLPQEFLESGVNEEWLEKLSRDIDQNVYRISNKSKKIHISVRHNEKKVALSNFIKKEQVPIKEPEQNLKRLSEHSKTDVSGKNQLGPLSDKVLYISQAHGWIDYNNTGAWNTQRGVTNEIVEDFVNAEAINQYLLEYLNNAGAKIFTLRERDLNVNMVIVDNEDSTNHPKNGTYLESGDSTLFSDSGANGFKNFQSPYQPTNDPFRDNGGTDRIIATSKIESARAIWKPQITQDGYYHVYVSYSGDGDRPSDAKYIVSHGGIETEVYVNQEIHRYVWNNIGRFYFKAGDDDFVALSNESSEIGTTVSADAIRIGGGYGDVLGNFHPVISSYPRWEEGARPYVQFQGASESVYASGDVGARSKFAAWENYALEDSLYVSWHSNGFDGNAKGTSSYIYSSNPPDGTFDTTQSVDGSAALQEAIHNELINDIRAGWQADWTDRGKRSAYFGEVNPANNDEMPSVLIEMAFHDNVDDADSLRHPQFRKLVARSIYQGIVKYFANRDGVEFNLLPEPITHLQVTSKFSGQLYVSWNAPLTDKDNVVGDSAETYMVYRSKDGYNFDNGVETNDLFYVFEDQNIGENYYIQVRAKNNGGLSLASETLGSRIAYIDENRVLIVNGFDRLNSGQLVNMTIPGLTGNVDRMFLNQMNTFDYTISHGESINQAGVGFDSISNELIEDSMFNLDIGEYSTVFWILGEESSAGSTLTSVEQGKLNNFLNFGGQLFISGAEIAWDLDHLGTASDKDFYHNVLMSEYVSDDADVFQVNELSGIFTGISPINFDDGSNGIYRVEYPDVISPLGSAQTCLEYLGAQSACTYVDTGIYQVIHLGFPFETIYPQSSRDELMAQALDYFAIPYFSDIIFSDGFE